MIGLLGVKENWDFKDGEHSTNFDLGPEEEDCWGKKS